MIERRDYKEPRYIAWRKAVYARDRYKCQMQGCCTKGVPLNAHHIKCWATYPLLRYVVQNGITLCKIHHDEVRGKERQYEDTFNSIVNRDAVDLRIAMIMSKYENTNE